MNLENDFFFYQNLEVMPLKLAGFYVISCEVYSDNTLLIHYAANKMSIDPNEHRFPAMIRIYKIFLLAEVMAFGNSHSSYDGIY